MLISIANSARTLFFFIQCTPFTQTPNCVFEKNEKVFRDSKSLVVVSWWSQIIKHVITFFKALTLYTLHFMLIGWQGQKLASKNMKNCSSYLLAPHAAQNGQYMLQSVCTDNVTFSLLLLFCQHTSINVPLTCRSKPNEPVFKHMLCVKLTQLL